MTEAEAIEAARGKPAGSITYYDPGPWWKRLLNFLLPQRVEHARAREGEAEQDRRYGFGKVVERPMPEFPEHILHQEGIRAQSLQDYASRYSAAERAEFAPEFRCRRDAKGHFLPDPTAPRDSRGRFV